MEVEHLQTNTHNNNLFETRRNNNYDALIRAIGEGCLHTINLLKETTPNLQLNGTMWDRGYPCVACADGQIHVALLKEAPEIDGPRLLLIPYACREGHFEIVSLY